MADRILPRWCILASGLDESTRRGLMLVPSGGLLFAVEDYPARTRRGAGPFGSEVADDDLGVARRVGLAARKHPQRRAGRQRGHEHDPEAGHDLATRCLKQLEDLGLDA